MSVETSVCSAHLFKRGLTSHQGWVHSVTRETELGCASGLPGSSVLSALLISGAFTALRPVVISPCAVSVRIEEGLGLTRSQDQGWDLGHFCS